MTIQALDRPLSIDSVHDGGAYRAPSVRLEQTNLFLRIGRLDEVFIKIPSKRGFGDYRTFVKRAERCPEDIRSLEEAERFDRLERALESLADLKPALAISADVAHYLVVHKIQYERLQSQQAVKVPRARFGLLAMPWLGILRRFEPVLFQQRVRGTTLWDMYDFDAKKVFSPWRQFRTSISSQLAGLLESGLRDHIDWNIRNFVFDKTIDRLFYVDQKPTTFVAKESNDRNLQGICDYFLK